MLTSDGDQGIGRGDFSESALDVAYAAHPKRFPNGPPQVRLPPVAVYINPIVTETAIVLAQDASGLTDAVLEPDNIEFAVPLAA